MNRLVAGSQLAGAQDRPAGCIWQPPTPLHSPLVPHEATGVSAQIAAGSVTPRARRGSGVSAGTSTQRPSALTRLQERQRPAQASVQQTPSAQKPDLQSSAPWQACPRPRLPQLPAAQVAGGTQSASLSQPSRQALPVHW